MFWLFFAPTFYDRVFLPCWNCYDFEATIAHEIGHALGFHHPDSHAAMNLRATAPMGPATCRDPLQYVAVESNIAAFESIMFSMTRHSAPP